MKMNKKRTSKLKIAVVVGLLCCMAMGMSVMAFDLYYQYNLGSNETKTIAQFVPNVSTIYLNTRPSTGGDVTIILSGAASGSSLFPYYTTRNAWVVSVPNPTATLTIRARAGANGSSGTLHVWG